MTSETQDNKPAGPPVSTLSPNRAGMAQRMIGILTAVAGHDDLLAVLWEIKADNAKQERGLAELGELIQEQRRNGIAIVKAAAEMMVDQPGAFGADGDDDGERTSAPG